MKRPNFENKIDLIKYLCETITPDPVSPHRFHLIFPELKASKKEIRAGWNDELTLFGHEIIKMFLDEYDHIPTPDELKTATLPRLTVTVGDEGVFWEIGVAYIKPNSLRFTPSVKYEAVILETTDEEREIVIKAIVEMEDKINT